MTTRGLLNRDLSSRQLTNGGLINDTARRLPQQVAEKKALPARAWFRAMKVARTIADLEESAVAGENHMAEALHLRFVEL